MKIVTEGAHLTFCSTVLSLRGAKTVTQPLQDPDGHYVLCWNGEAWSFDGDPSTGNDTEAVHKLLSDTVASSSKDHSLDALDEGAKLVATALSRVAGPYAFVFSDAPRQRLFLGRDFLGRRSLLFRITAAGEVIFSSVSCSDYAEGWQELNADGIYCFSLRNTGSQPAHVRHFGDFAVGHATYNFADADPGNWRSNKCVVPRLVLNTTISPRTVSLTAQSASVSHLADLLHESLSLRVLAIPEPPYMPNAVGDSGASSNVAVLFSGGLDCTVLARIAHDLLPKHEPVDLLNVAFENPRIHSSLTNGSALAYELCPDRITGRASFAELQQTCPGRLWRFVAIDIPYTETIEHRQAIVSIMHPHNTEMDLSISLALYFAARGGGQIDNTLDGTSFQYTTSARVLLSGLGADELFGGYTRHATAYRRGGTPALLDELQLDVSRLGQRNLGRDDRVMSHWGREVRFPYLDEKLLSWALAANVNEKCGFKEMPVDANLPAVEGSGMLEPSKKVLRCLAWKLGMSGVAKEKKRAIQFGARTAKMDTRKSKGTQAIA